MAPDRRGGWDSPIGWTSQWGSGSMQYACLKCTQQLLVARDAVGLDAHEFAAFDARAIENLCVRIIRLDVAKLSPAQRDSLVTTFGDFGVRVEMQRAREQHEKRHPAQAIETTSITTIEEFA